MYRLHGNSGASLQDRLIDASATELSSTRWQADHAGAAEARTARGAASSSAASMPGAAHTTAPASLISIGADADPLAVGGADAFASATIGTSAQTLVRISPPMLPAAERNATECCTHTNPADRQSTASYGAHAAAGRSASARWGRLLRALPIESRMRLHRVLWSHRYGLPTRPRRR